MNSFFKNTFVVLYPFIPLEIDGENYTGFEFRSIKIHHYLPVYSNIKKPRNKELRKFFDNFIKQSVDEFGQRLIGFGYSVHRYKNLEQKEVRLNQIRNFVELLYLLYNQNNDTMETSFPKFYVIDNVNHFENKDFVYTFNLFENLEKNNHHFLSKESSHPLRKDLIQIRMRSNRFRNYPYVDGRWKRVLKRGLTEVQYRSIFWSNNAKDSEKTVLEKIISSTIAVEGLIKIRQKEGKKKNGEKWKEYWSDAFARVIVDEFKSDVVSFETRHLSRIKEALKQAANVRSSIVHGGKLYGLILPSEYNKDPKDTDIRINFDGNRSIFIHTLLTDIFEIALVKKVLKDATSASIKFESLIDKVYPNSDIISSALKLLRPNKIKQVLESLQGLKKQDQVGLKLNELETIYNYINDNQKALNDLNIDYKNLGAFQDLVKSEKGWLEIHNLSQQVDRSRFNLKIYKSVTGLVDFLELLSEVVMWEGINLLRASKN